MKEDGIKNDVKKKTAVPARPPFWLRLSIPAGNALQLCGLILGGALLFLDARLTAAAGLRVLLMFVGWFIIYIDCHAIGHYLVGRLVGIRFREYGVRGTDHPENYPPVARQLMSAMPTFTVMTEKTSMEAASPWARALMFSAGESFTAIFSILAALYAWLAGIPGGFAWLVIMVVFNIASTIMTSIVPRGDYAKARKALAGKK